MTVEFFYEDYIDILISWANKNDVVDFPRDRESLKAIKELTISNLDLHCIPTEIFYLKQLEELRFFHTTMASIPKELKLLVNLKRLGIYYHHFILELPIEIGELSNLEDLVIYDCSLKSLPKEIGNLSKLQKFELNREYSILSLPHEFGNLLELKELIITNTKIEVFPKSFENLINLTSVRIERNRIKRFPSFLFKNRNLEQLTLSECWVKSITSEIKQLEGLKNLYLSCSLDFIPNEICHLNNLQIFYLSSENAPLKDLPKDFSTIAKRGIFTIENESVSYDENSLEQKKQLLEVIFLVIFHSNCSSINENTKKQQIQKEVIVEDIEVPDIEKNMECNIFIEHNQEQNNKLLKDQIIEEESLYPESLVEWAHDH